MYLCPLHFILFECLQLHVHLFIILHHLKVLIEHLLQFNLNASLRCFWKMFWFHSKILFHKINIISSQCLYFSLFVGFDYSFEHSHIYIKIGIFDVWRIWICFFICYLLVFTTTTLFVTCNNQVGNNICIIAH
jgi:hypothetical protein